MSVKHAVDVTRAHPDLPEGSDALTECLRACAACVVSCAGCADACLSEEGDMTECIRSCTACAAICTATVRVLSQVGYADNDVTYAQVRASKLAAQRCQEICSSHDDEHCKTCAEICGWCVDACDAVLAS